MKRILLTMACAVAVGTVMARNTVSANQEKAGYGTDKTQDGINNQTDGNWFVSVGGGAQIYFGDHDRQVEFGKRLAPALDIAAGRWFSPILGARLMYSGLQVKGATQKGKELVHATGKDVPGKSGNGYWLEEQKFNMFNIHADLMVNATNLVFGVNPQRVWDCSPYAGIGVAHVSDKPTTSKVSGNLGLLNSFHLTPALDLNLDLRTMFVGDSFDGEKGGRKGEAMLGATVGLTYKFGK